jgi:hypothetical protein
LVSALWSRLSLHDQHGSAEFARQLSRVNGR